MDDEQEKRRSAKEKETMALKDELAGSPTDDRATSELGGASEKVERDTAGSAVKS